MIPMVRFDLGFDVHNRARTRPVNSEGPNTSIRSPFLATSSPLTSAKWSCNTRRMVPFGGSLGVLVFDVFSGVVVVFDWVDCLRFLVVVVVFGLVNCLRFLMVEGPVEEQCSQMNEVCNSLVDTKAAQSSWSNFVQLKWYCRIQPSHRTKYSLILSFNMHEQTNLPLHPFTARSMTALMIPLHTFWLWRRFWMRCTTFTTRCWYVDVDPSDMVLFFCISATIANMLCFATSTADTWTVDGFAFVFVLGFGFTLGVEFFFLLRWEGGLFLLPDFHSSSLCLFSNIWIIRYTASLTSMVAMASALKPFWFVGEEEEEEEEEVNVVRPVKCLP